MSIEGTTIVDRRDELVVTATRKGAIEPSEPNILVNRPPMRMLAADGLSLSINFRHPLVRELQSRDMETASLASSLRRFTTFLSRQDLVTAVPEVPAAAERLSPTWLFAQPRVPEHRPPLPTVV